MPIIPWPARCSGGSAQYIARHPTQATMTSKAPYTPAIRAELLGICLECAAILDALGDPAQAARQGSRHASFGGPVGQLAAFAALGGVECNRCRPQRGLVSFHGGTWKPGPVIRKAGPALTFAGPLQSIAVDCVKHATLETAMSPV